jgi:predicted component of type VI protein secretion system
MAKLLFFLDGQLLGEYLLDKPLLRIGRRRDNDIVIDNLMISSEHAQVMAIGQNALLQDLDSTNGTMVNGVRVKQHVLQHDDIIMLGRYQLRYWDEAASGHHSSADAAAMTHEIDALGKFPRDSQSEGKGALAERCSGRLYVISGPDFGKDILLSHSVIHIGDPELPVAKILQNGRDYCIQPLSGVESVMVNGQALTDSVAGEAGWPLQDHDLIAYGGVKMEFYLAADEGER